MGPPPCPRVWWTIARERLALVPVVSVVVLTVFVLSDGGVHLAAIPEESAAAPAWSSLRLWIPWSIAARFSLCTTSERSVVVLRVKQRRWI
ncbi:MAG: hypothetical protein U0269_34205 [Polyangiales bacterium]